MTGRYVVVVAREWRPFACSFQSLEAAQEAVEFYRGNGMNAKIIYDGESLVGTQARQALANKINSK